MIVECKNIPSFIIDSAAARPSATFLSRTLPNATLIFLRVDPTTTADLVSRSLQIQPLPAAFLPLIQIQLNDSIFRSDMFKDLRDGGLIRDGSSFFLKGDVHIVILNFVELNQILKDVFYFCLRLDLKNDLLHLVEV